jgi:hypothetical protein
METRAIFDKLNNQLRENGTSYALIVASIIGSIYFNRTLIDVGTSGSAFRISTSIQIPVISLLGIGLLLFKNWPLKLVGALLLFAIIQEISYVIATLHPLGKFP